LRFLAEAKVPSMIVFASARVSPRIRVSWSLRH
jgi:hypothetical protein